MTCTHYTYIRDELEVVWSDVAPPCKWFPLNFYIFFFFFNKFKNPFFFFLNLLFMEITVAKNVILSLWWVCWSLPYYLHVFVFSLPLHKFDFPFWVGFLSHQTWRGGEAEYLRSQRRRSGVTKKYSFFIFQWNVNMRLSISTQYLGAETASF